MRGCAAIITDKLNALHGVRQVSVDVDRDLVNVSYTEDTAVRKEISDTLTLLGYPETGTTNNLFEKAKSYISCAIGKMKKLNLALCVCLNF